MIKRLFRITLATLLVAAVLGFLAGCNTAPEVTDESVAAKVNNHEILENTVTEYISDYRSSNELDDDKDFAQWLVNEELTAETFRKSVLDSFIRSQIIKDEAASKGIVVTDEEVDAEINELAQHYGTQEDMELDLKAMGYTLETYREVVREQLYQQRLTDQLPVESNDQELLSTINGYSEMLNGAREIKTIVRNQEDRELMGNIHAAATAEGADFNALANEFSLDNSSDGWDLMVPIDTVVYDRLPNMNLGDVSDVIVGEDGKLYIVKVTNIIETDGFATLSDVPESLRTSFSDNMRTLAQAEAFEKNISELIESADVVIYDMPRGLPYDVSLLGVKKQEQYDFTADTVEEEFVESNLE